jgi:hypothetical protein
MELGDVQRYWGSVNPGWQSVSKPETRGSAIIEQIELQKDIDAMPEGPMKDKMNEFFMRAKNFGLSGKGIEQGVKQDYAGIPPAEEKAFRTSRAGEMGRSKGETASNVASIPGYRPIAGAKITDSGVENVRKVSPDIETMKGLTKEILDKYKSSGSKIVGNDAAWYFSKIRQLQLLAKSPALFNLGVLTGPDLMLLEQTIPNPASAKELLKKQIFGDIDVKLNSFNDFIDSRGKAFYRANGFEPDVSKSTRKVWNEKTGKFEVQ